MKLNISVAGWITLLCMCAPALRAAQQNDPASVVPDKAPRIMVLAGRNDAFRDYCLKGDGAKAFAKIKADLDASYIKEAFPDEPLTYGDPDPKKRDSDKADKWRAVQDLAGRVSAIAEAAVLVWVVTGEDRYLQKAKEFLLGSCEWHFGPEWKKGPVKGATDIEYNDEAHFRLWRKMPLVYDQIRNQLSPDQKKTVLAHFKERGARSVRWISPEKIGKIRRNSVESDAPSHSVRFMAMTGLSGLALWDDLPEAKQWWAFAYKFYRDQFSPWGGEEGGWAEGPAYWRGTFEHAAFQDALLAIGDPSAYASAFWKNSPYFAVYNVQPYLHTIFGDTSNAGRFNLDPNIADFMEHMSRVTQDGHFLAYAKLCTDQRPRPAEKGLGTLDRIYPTACEFLVRDFIASSKPLPAPKPLTDLPSHRYFKDIGWVSMHSALGRPDDDIHITFKSSPYGSYSHSHADQNAFILNAFGEGLAINSAYREFHRSPLHQQWTWQTRSKNAVLIDGAGQKPQDKKAAGNIIRFEAKDRVVWACGDAAAAYRTGQESETGDRIERVTRDLAFVDSRYVVLRDRITLKTPGKLSWLLHAENDLSWDASANRATIVGAERKAALTAQLLAAGIKWTHKLTDKFPVPVDPKYTSEEAGSGYVTAKWTSQRHLSLESAEAAKEFTIFSVLWPSKGAPQNTVVKPLDTSTIEVKRPDGKSDFVRISDQGCDVSGTLLPPLASTPQTSKTTSLAGAQPTANAPVADEIAPKSLPGAEAFIYRETQPEPLRLHVFKPKGWKKDDRRPALVFFFGGGWSKGTPEKSATWGKFAADNDMVGVSPDYRTMNRFNTSPLESVADARASVRWVQDHAAELGVDPARIVVGGNSAGGHLALWTAISKPPPGSSPDETPRPKPAALLLMSTVSDTSMLSGYTPKRFGTNATPLSPIHNLDSEMPPILALHGDADKTVPSTQAIALRDKLSATDARCQLVLVPGGDHNFSSQLPGWKEKGRAIILEFLRQEKLVK